jgi:hypothetical protein
MSVNSRAKGARGEREFAALLRERFPDLEFERGIQTRGGGAEAADVFGLPGIHWEVKRVEKLNIWAALVQAETDADYASEIPVVAFRQNRSPWYVALPAHAFLDLYSRNSAPPTPNRGG